MTISKEKTNKITKMLRTGFSIEDVHKMTGLSSKYLQKNFGYILERRNFKVLGHKSEAYYVSEEEMLKPLEYSYKDLSASEKKIYKLLGKGGVSKGEV